MIHFDFATIDNVQLKIGLNEEDGKLYVSFNNLMSIFNATMMDKTCDDVTCALMNTEYRNHIVLDDTEFFEDNVDYVSKQLWVDVACFKFLAEESNAPFLFTPLVDFITQNETALIEELRKTL
jgi:hypothetical protein